MDLTALESDAVVHVNLENRTGPNPGRLELVAGTEVIIDHDILSDHALVTSTSLVLLLHSKICLQLTVE